jgi:molybdopterin-containing oxidoreductase family iron-sulfur binding subunit
MDQRSHRDDAKTPCRGGDEGLVRLGERPPEYWRSVDELRGAAADADEFAAGLGDAPHDVTRRDFLSMAGFSLAAATLAGCRAPVEKAIPMLVGSEQIVPGRASYYATTCAGCPSACSLLVKQRDGRPIKIEGNPASSLFGGGTCATGQAAVLSLYDDERLRGPLWQGKPVSWVEVDRRVLESLRAAEITGGRIVLLSGTVASPSTRRIIEAWSERSATFRHVVYDAVSLCALRKANEVTFGRAVIPHYRFDAARVIVALEADFLGTWLSPVEFARQFAANRRREGPRPLHVHFESGLSLTGSNADVRVPVPPSRLGLVALGLLRRVARRAGAGDVPVGPEPVDPKRLDAVADALWKNRGRSLVVSGVQDVSVQVVVNSLNHLLSNIGRTVDLARPSLQRQGDDGAMAELVEEMNRGRVHTLLLYGVNPGYDYWDAPRFMSGLKQVALSLSFADRLDETSSAAQAVCPDHHFLEAWGDAEPVHSHFSLAQPLVAPLFDTRAAQESLLRWLGAPAPDHYTHLRDFWRRELFPRQSALRSFDDFWDRSLREGVFVAASTEALPPASFRGGWKAAAQGIVAEEARAESARRDGHYEVQLYESVALRDGRHANNPWLQELPDPVSKVTWGNFAAVAPALAARLGLANGDVVALKRQGARLELPVVIQPGQDAGTISVALGHGRKKVGKVGREVGANAFPWATGAGGVRRYSGDAVAVDRTGRKDPVASTQTHFSMEGRPIVLETTIEDLRRAEDSGAGVEVEALPSLWAERPGGEHAWGMAIDLDACIGCSACVVACQAENNVPVVGKDQVRRTRAMHWIRIDHYYRGPEDEPASLHQPMMCQHCGHAPCETVCPVLATTTSSEGLNQQVYNRCIGTRYCANNCPYKVRRFNWYDYTHDARFGFHMTSPLGRMALNPDVAVRSRGVMEKCSLCVQRIQQAKSDALQRQRPLDDGDIQTACQQACPTQAITFGDLKDPKSRLSALRRSPRHYRVLEELGTRPSVGYLKRIRGAEET